MLNDIFNDTFIWPPETDRSGFVRVFHAVPGGPDVDIYADGMLIIEGLSYGQMTEYLAVPAGRYEIAVYPSGNQDTPILRNMLHISQDSFQTVAAVGMVDSVGLLAIPDASAPLSSGEAMVRFSHLSPNAPAVDITLPDGTVIFRNVSYKQLTPYIAVPTDEYTLQVRPTGTDTVVLTIPDITLEPDAYYTIYAIGLLNGQPELDAIPIIDGMLE